MENYKIKVNDEAESKEAQELFFELGYVWNTGLGVKYLDGKFLYARNGIITLGFDSDNFDNSTYKELTLPQLRDLVAKSKKEQGLISGADAKLAWAKGEDVQISGKTRSDWHLIRKCDLPLSVFEDNDFIFRIKPHTITLNIEIPAPFEPKDGEVFYALAPTAVGGYSKMHITDQKRMDDYAKLGAWRTEEEIKQVVAALRQGFKL